MNGVVDVGDAVDVTFTTTTGADVTLTWLDPDQQPVITDQTVAEDPAGSGLYPATLLPTSGGIWTAVFTASGTVTAVERFYIRAEAPSAVPPLATVGDLVEVFRPLTDAETSLAWALLRHASRLVRNRWPDVDTRIAAGTLDPQTAALAVVNMVLRVMRNPSGLRSQTTGPFSRTFDPQQAGGFLRITDAEIALLAPDTAEPVVPAGTIRVQPGLAPPPHWHRTRRRDVRLW